MIRSGFANRLATPNDRLYSFLSFRLRNYSSCFFIQITTSNILIDTSLDRRKDLRGVRVCPSPVNCQTPESSIRP